MTCAVTLRLKGMNLLVVCLYLTTGENASRSNNTKLSEVITFIKQVGGHYVILADWNMTPEELVRWGVLQSIGGEILKPQAEFTCGGLSCVFSTMQFAVWPSRPCFALMSRRPSLGGPMWASSSPST